MISIDVYRREIFFCAGKAVTDAEDTATFEDIPDVSSIPSGG
jgi:hypothetical protein